LVPNFKGQESKKKKKILDPEDGTYRLSRNTGKELPLLTV
jgi:hypothetical protein